MTVIAFPKPRTLTFVFAELLLLACKLDELRTSVRGREPSEDEDDRWTELEAAIELRRVEARAIIEKAVGVPWDTISAADL